MNWLFVGLHVIMCSLTNLYAITMPTQPSRGLSRNKVILYLRNWLPLVIGRTLLDKQEFEGYILWSLHLLDRSDVRPHGVIYRERWRCCRTFVRSQ